jgi:hypothetical protein
MVLLCKWLVQKQNQYGMLAILNKEQEKKTKMASSPFKIKNMKKKQKEIMHAN